ncbi:MAG: hypothetical protein ACOC0L_01485 [bacterium]
MNIKCIGYYITVCAIVWIGAVIPARGRDVGPRWIETARWRGNGSVYTEPFYIAGERWRVKFYPEGTPPFHINVCDATAKPVAEAAVAEELLPGWRTFSDEPGYRILRILGSQVSWTVTVEQRMTVQDQWTLAGKQKDHVPVYSQTGVWSGEGPAEPVRFKVPVEDAPWRMVVQNEESGRLDVTLRDASGNEVVAAEMEQAGAVESWGYAAGEFTLEIGAGDTAWTVRMYAAGLSQ